MIPGSRKVSKQTVIHIADILHSARSSLAAKQSDPEGDDGAELMEALKTGDAYRISLACGSTSAFFVKTTGYTLLLDKPSKPAILRDGWQLLTLGCAFSEQDFRNLMSGVRSYADFLAEYSIGEDDFCQLSGCAWSQYACGLQSDWDRSSRILLALAVRGCAAGSDNYEYGHIWWTVTSFLLSGAPTPESLEDLSHVPPMAGLAACWEDDEQYLRRVDEMCEWHLRIAVDPDAVSYRGQNHDLFPSWIFALHRHRLIHLGRPGLSDHPLLDYGKRIIEADFSGPKLPILEMAEARYRELYGDDEIDFAALWRDFRRDHP